VARPDSLKQTQLRGLRAVHLSVFVDRAIDGYADLERTATVVAREALARDGDLATTDGPEGTWLSVQVLAYDPRDQPCPGNSIIVVRVQLREQVRLKRDPSLIIPGGDGAVTWFDEWVDVESKASARAAILKDVDWRVGSFAADVKQVNQ
jgi:hypothetical protein